jgi:hypothetical protein
MSCKPYQIKFQNYTEGIITPHDLEDLQRHSKQCKECGRSFEEFRQMQEMLTDSLGNQNNSNAKKKLSAKIAQQNIAYPRPVRSQFGSARWLGYAAAAGFFLAIGVLIGSWDKIQVISKQPKSLAISISNLQGDILIKHPWEISWKTLAANEPIYKGDAFLSLNQSAVRLVLGPNKYVELDQNSSLNLMQYNGQTEFGIAYGTVKSSLDGPHEPFFISTPQGRLQALGTEFIVRVR